MRADLRIWRATTALAAIALLVSLFLPWTRACGAGGPCQTTHGWSPELGVAAGILAFAVLTAARLGQPRVARELALGSAFLVGVLMFQTRPSHQGAGTFAFDRAYAYGVWVGVAAAAAMLLATVVWAAGGRAALVAELPPWARVDRV